MFTSEVAVVKSHHSISVKCSRYQDTRPTDPALFPSVDTTHSVGFGIWLYRFNDECLPIGVDHLVRVRTPANRVHRQTCEKQKNSLKTCTKKTFTETVTKKIMRKVGHCHSVFRVNECFCHDKFGGFIFIDFLPIIASYLL